MILSTTPTIEENLKNNLANGGKHGQHNNMGFVNSVRNIGHTQIDCSIARQKANSQLLYSKQYSRFYNQEQQKQMEVLR